MSDTISRPPARHLQAVANDLSAAAEAASDHASEAFQLAVRNFADHSPATSKPVLHMLARLDVEQARKFVMELDTAAASTSPLLAMFLLGRCAEHAQALLDVIDATVTL